jgi:hypothetical protein
LQTNILIATLVRLLTINALNAYLTSMILYLSGGSEDARLLLPAWISIASILTLLYHSTQRHTNIRKETSASISVFSIASFISMTSLMLQLYLTRLDDPEIPLFSGAKHLWRCARTFALVLGNHIGVGRITRGQEL